TRQRRSSSTSLSCRSPPLGVRKASTLIILRARGKFPGYSQKSSEFSVAQSVWGAAHHQFTHGIQGLPPIPCGVRNSKLGFPEPANFFARSGKAEKTVD